MTDQELKGMREIATAGGALDKVDAAGFPVKLYTAPQAEPVAWDGKLPESLQRALNEMRVHCKPHIVSGLEFEVRQVFEGMHTSLSTVRRMYRTASDRLEAIDEAQPDPLAAPQAQPADALDAETPYQRGYRHGYNQRDAEVQGALL